MFVHNIFTCVSDPKKWVKGSRPEDWLEFIDHVNEHAAFSSDIAKHEALSDIYHKALKVSNIVCFI